MREYQARFCEKLGVKFPWFTRSVPHKVNLYRSSEANELKLFGNSLGEAVYYVVVTLVAEM